MVRCPNTEKGMQSSRDAKCNSKYCQQHPNIIVAKSPRGIPIKVIAKSPKVIAKSPKQSVSAKSPAKVVIHAKKSTKQTTKQVAKSPIQIAKSPTQTAKKVIVVKSPKKEPEDLYPNRMKQYQTVYQILTNGLPQDIIDMIDTYLSPVSEEQADEDLYVLNFATPGYDFVYTPQIPESREILFYLPEEKYREYIEIYNDRTDPKV